MHTINDVHQQFATFFAPDALKPYAYLLSKKLQEGHICIPVPLTYDDIELLPESYRAMVNKSSSLVNQPMVSTAEGLRQPFILHQHNLYLQRYFNYETIVLNRIQAFVESGHSQREARMKLVAEQQSLIAGLFSNDNAHDKTGEKVDWQLVGAVMAVLNQFTIITGGPGTGKTTTVAKILAILFSIQPQLKVALAAPTGKAAVRMAESLRGAINLVPPQVKTIFEHLVPATLHRLLGYMPNATGFRFNKENPLQYDVVIVDESSMIDVALFAKLLQAIGPQTRLILLGDKDQLASVEAGSLFGDMCNANTHFSLLKETAAFINKLVAAPGLQLPESAIGGQDTLLFEHIVELKESRRFSSAKGIGKLSKAIINSDVAALHAFASGKDEQVQVDTTYNDHVFEQFVQGYEEYIQEKDIAAALKKMQQLRVLCATRDGEHGLYALNRKIERYLEQKRQIEPAQKFYENRPVIITKNYYELDLFNGDTGLIRTDENNITKAWFQDSNGGLKWVLPGFITEAETVFAMTIHKSQGSEYNQVLVVLPDNADLPLLTAELLYTAVTRAKSKVTIQATQQVIEATAARRVKRASGIIERFAQATLYTP